MRTDMGKRMHIPMVTPMAEHGENMGAGGLYRLLAWLSPSYPVGAFSYSHGLEWAVETGDVRTAEDLRTWVGDILAHGGGRQDAILLAAAWRARRGGDGTGLAEVSELAGALSPTRERRLETLAQGTAFRLATQAAWPAGAPDEAAGQVAYPVAVGVAAADHQVPLDAALVAYLHAFAANIVSAGVRLVPLGQTDGQRIVAALEPAVRAAAEEARAATLDDLGGCALLADIASMRHETQYTRLFRT